MEIFRFMGWTLRLCCVEVVHFPMHPISFYLVILKSACVSHCACVSGLWSWDTPVLYPYSDKKLCSSPPSVDFFASDMPTRKNKHWTRGQKQKFFNLTPHSAWSCSSLNITNTHLKNLVAKNFHSVVACRKNNLQKLLCISPQRSHSYAQMSVCKKKKILYKKRKHLKWPWWSGV